MARKGNPISVRRDLNRSSDSSWFSDYYYGKLVYQDVNLRSYFGSIRPPTRLTFGFRLGRCIILHFPKRTFIHFFLPRLPRRQKRREKARPGKEKGRFFGGAFGKVGPIGCLHSSDGTEEERNEVRGRGAGKRVESIRLDDREKQNEIRIWPKKKQGYGYHDQSPSIKKTLSKLLRVSGAFKHPKYAGIVNDIAFLIKNDDSVRKTKLFKFFFPKKSRSDRPTSHLLKRTLPAVRPSLNYLVMQYLLNTKKKMNFDPVVVLNHFVAPGVAEPSTMGGANTQERSLDKRIRSRIAFFVESSTSEKKCLAEAKKRLIHFIRQANDLRFAGTTKTTISLFPFFGALSPPNPPPKNREPSRDWTAPNEYFTESRQGIPLITGRFDLNNRCPPSCTYVSCICRAPFNLSLKCKSRLKRLQPDIRLVNSLEIEHLPLRINRSAFLN